MDWRERFEAEMDRGAQARGRGNEGQARVCARRAAGLAAAEYFRRRGHLTRSSSAIDVLNELAREPSLPDDLEPLLTHLLQRVSPEFQLPPDVDLLADARLLEQQLLID